MIKGPSVRVLPLSVGLACMALELDRLSDELALAIWLVVFRRCPDTMNKFWRTRRPDRLGDTYARWTRDGRDGPVGCFEEHVPYPSYSYVDRWA